MVELVMFLVSGQACKQYRPLHLRFDEARQVGSVPPLAHFHRLGWRHLDSCRGTSPLLQVWIPSAGDNNFTRISILLSSTYQLVSEVLRLVKYISQCSSSGDDPRCVQFCGINGVELESTSR